MTQSLDVFFPTPYQEFIYLSRYSRFLWDKSRREIWPETVARYFDFFTEHLQTTSKYKLDAETRHDLEQAILHLHVMPSMRCLMTAGEALHRENIAGYNCSFLELSRPQAFDELLYILLNGTGVGFSVERDKIQQLPTIAEEFHHTETTIVVGDSKLGWAKAYKELIGLLYQGAIPKWDLSKVRAGGSPLKTFGGRASGPEPLNDLFTFAVALFQIAAGRKLTSLECHDLACKTGQAVIVGGVRRSALISLSDVDDDRMRHAKYGQWWIEHPERALANNSVAHRERPDLCTFIDEWRTLYNSKSGERGIFNRLAAQEKLKESSRRDPNYSYGINPCGEIILRDRQLCNLSEVVCRASDTMATLKEKVRQATILGTFQATLTNFKYVTAKWKHNCEEERLLGVSLTGVMDCPLLNTISPATITRLKDLKAVAVETNIEWAKKLKINPATAVTCVKPSGTISQLTDSSSGIHARHSRYYIRTVRLDKTDPLMSVLTAHNIPHEDDVSNPSKVAVFSFPIQSPADAIIRSDRSAVEQLEFWKMYHDHWCEHNPSVTISVKEAEWLDVAAWVYRHFNKMCGVAFLPYSDHSYRQAPFQECTEEMYLTAKAKMPQVIDWASLSKIEHTDTTLGSQELACVAGSCDLL